MFGARLRALRKERGLTQEELALKADLTGRHLSRFETGNLVPPARTIQRLADALEVTVEELTQESPRAALKTLLPDPELLQQFQALSKMDEGDLAAVKRVLAAMIMKQQMQEMLSGRSA